MKLSKFGLNYFLANSIVALTALGLVLLLGRSLGASRYGELAGLFALQNIWAGLGFLRIETRIATCRTKIGVNRILITGFFLGLLASLLLTFIFMYFWGFGGGLYLVFLSGFSLAILDALILKNAYSGKQAAVASTRAFRIIFPLAATLLITEFTSSVKDIFLWQTILLLTGSILIWGRLVFLGRPLQLSILILGSHWRGLVPSILLCMLNGVWINGLVPFLNAFGEHEAAGQFSMLQRILGGSLGLVSTSVTMLITRRDFVDVQWPILRRAVFTNAFISLLICILFAIPIFGSGNELLGAGWRYTLDFYFSMSIFLIASFSIGAISITAIRLKDEWFLSAWQAAALFAWGLVFWITPRELFLNVALCVGAAMYILLGLRWQFITKGGLK